METTTITNGKSKKTTAAVTAPPEKEVTSILIPKIKIITTTVRVKGISPLIVHAWGHKAKEQMRVKQQKLAKQAKEAKDPQQDFNEARYLDADGKDCVPALAFKNAAVEAAVLADVFKTTIRKAFFVRGELLPIKSKPPVMREDMVRVGMGTADLRYRPMYEDWSVDVPIEFNARLISAEQLFNLFELAGYSIGICEWRPERDGQFGRFSVIV